MTTIEEAKRQAEQARVNALSAKLGGPASNMTLRDYFATAAMQGFAADPTDSWKDGVTGMAKSAYQWADAMMEARK